MVCHMIGLGGPRGARGERDRRGVRTAAVGLRRAATAVVGVHGVSLVVHGVSRVESSRVESIVGRKEREKGRPGQDRTPETRERERERAVHERC